MAVKIRLKRLGKKKDPRYRIVIAHEQNPRDGKVIENVGTYNPIADPVDVKVHEDRVKYWMSVGAQPTDTVKRLLAGLGLVKAKKVTSSNQKISKKDRNKAED